MHRVFLTGIVVLALFPTIVPGRAVAQGPPRAAPVEVETVVEAEIVPTTSMLGTTEPRRRSIVSASIEGHVLEYPIKEGARVEAGDVLARLRDSTLGLRLRELRAALDEIREHHRNARADLKRARELVEKDAITEKDLDEAITAERTLALRIPQAEIKVKILELDIEKKKIVAPFRGQIVREHTEVGEWLPRGGKVATLVDISTVYVRVDVPERHIRFVHPGQIVDVRVAAAQAKPLRARVDSVSDEGDPDSRTFRVRVDVKNDGKLRAGMSARVEFPTGEPRRALVVPKDALVTQGVLSLVYIITAAGKAQRRSVTIGPASGSRLAVLHGLEPGMKVIVKGNERIRPGLPVRVVARSEKGSVQ